MCIEELKLEAREADETYDRLAAAGLMEEMRQFYGYHTPAPAPNSESEEYASNLEALSSVDEANYIDFIEFRGEAPFRRRRTAYEKLY